MLIISLVILVLYLIIVGSLIYGFDKVKDVHLRDVKATTCFSIIIPFRNEVETLPTLLKTLKQLSYSHTRFEVIFIDDFSEDNSAQTIRNQLSQTTLDYSIINGVSESKSPKKAAISKAIAQAKHEWIITTDADCILPKYWLDTFDSYIQENNVNCIVAPVTYEHTNSFLKRFQLLDFLSLQGATIGGFGIQKPFLCNGANFCYTKTLFNQVNGFDENLHISSGDDIFLLQKVIQSTPEQVHYLKHSNAIVSTLAQPNLNLLISQRVRWAAKTSSYNNLFGKLVGLIVFMMNGYLVCAPLFVLANFISLKTLVYIFVVKFCIDFLLLFKTSRFFNQESYLSSYLFSGLLYPIFSVYVAFLSVFTGFKWKHRSYSK